MGKQVNYDQYQKLTIKFPKCLDNRWKSMKADLFVIIQK